MNLAPKCQDVESFFQKLDSMARMGRSRWQGCGLKIASHPLSSVKMRRANGLPYLRLAGAAKDMAGNILSNRPVYGRTFHTAMWTIGLVAAAQLFAVIRAVMTRPAFTEVAITETVTGPPLIPMPQPITTESVPVPMTPSETLLPDQIVSGEVPVAGRVGESIPVTPPGISESPGGPVVPTQPMPITPVETNPLPQPSFVGPSDAVPPSLSESLSSAAAGSEEIEDKILERLVSAGEELRASGNMPGALQALREVEAALPDHPRVLGEMAATFSQMGLDEKATVYWEKIVSLGSVRGGGYYELAQRQLKGEQVPAFGASGQVMKIGEIEVTERPPSDGGQHVSLRIVVDADPASNLIGSEMSLLVYFYDLVDGEMIDPSTADTSYDYPTKEYDWRDGGREEIVVEYKQPVFSEEELRELGARRYYGYVIELYYQDKLQDRVEKPEELSQFRMESVPEPETIAPQNGLFPDTPSF